IETDKSNMEIEAFDEGVLLRVDAPEGTTVPVDAVVAWIGTLGEDLPEPGGSASGAMAPVPSAARSGGDESVNADPVRASSSQGQASPTTSPPEVSRIGRLAISPRASRLAAELGVDPRSVSGTGPGGRIVERDIQAGARGPAQG